MNPDDIINTYKEKLGEQPSLEAVERERDETLKKVSKAHVLARLKGRIQNYKTSLQKIESKNFKDSA